VDKEGNTVFRLSPKRDVATAKAFFRKALRTPERAPISITLDGYAASHRAVREMSSKMSYESTPSFVIEIAEESG
jgi:transposase-like protein